MNRIPSRESERRAKTDELGRMGTTGTYGTAGTTGKTVREGSTELVQKRKGRKVPSIRYEARSRGRSPPDSFMAFRRPDEKADYCLDCFIELMALQELLQLRERTELRELQT